MRQLQILIISTIILFNFSSCKTLKIEKPAESYLPSSNNSTMSEFPLRVDLNVKKLEANINSKLNGLIFDGSNISNQDLSVKIWKAQNFQFTLNNNVIEYTIPLKIWTKFAWKYEKFGIAVGDNYEANGSISLKYKTTINIDKNWKLVCKTTAIGYDWIDKPQINVVGVNVPVTPIANVALSRCDKLVSEQIDKYLAETVNLKKYVGEVWNTIQKPQQVNTEHNLWVKISPKDIYMSPITTNANNLNVAVALYAQIETIMGGEPKALKATSLPEFKYVNRPAQQFNLNIGTDVTFEKVMELSKKQLLGKTFSQGNKKITITDLSIYGSAGKAIFIADVIGSLKGRIYFTGNMTYNPESESVVITEPEFDVKTSNALVKSANWLLHGMILKQLTPYLTYPVKDHLESVKLEANKMLANYSVVDGVLLQGKLNTVEVKNLELVPGALRIQSNVKGNVLLKVDNLKF